MQYTYSGKTDIGLERKVNQDSFGAIDSDWGSIFILSDGFGHKEGGKLASQSTVDFFIENFSKIEPKNIKQFLESTFQEINRYIYYKKVSTYKKAMLGCTAVVLVLIDETAHIAHIGDSRAYLVQNEQIQQLTTDHSYVQMLIDNGELSAEEAKFHSKRHVLKKALGNYNFTKPDYSSMSTNKNDIFTLCCDGVWGALSSANLKDILIQNKPEIATNKIIDAVKNNLGSDNITIQIISLLR